MRTTKTTLSLAILLAVSSLLTAPGAARAARYHVAPAPAGSDAYGGTSWTDAFATIGKALATATAPGDVVVVSNGTFTLTGELVVSNAVTIAGTNGAAATIVDGNAATRCFALSNSQAVVQGLTLRNGSADLKYHASRKLGGGAIVFAGTVRDCTISGNTGQDGGGVYVMTGAVLTNCLITGNTCHGYGGGVCNLFHSGGSLHSCTITDNRSNGGGIYLKAPTVENCRLVDNYSNGYAGGAGVIFGGIIRNCLIAGNEASTQPGGFTLEDAAVMENCTIASNMTLSAVYPGGIRAEGGTTVRNTIIAGNRGYAGEYTLTSVNVTYSRMDPLFPGTGNTNANPAFVNPAAGDFRLDGHSPLIDQGQNQAWMTTTLTQDLDGGARISPTSGGTVDMGCYEVEQDALTCYLEADDPEGFAPHAVNFTAHVFGANQAGLYYKWSYTNSAVIDHEGAAAASASHTYGAGLHTVTLTVTNSAGESAVRTRTNYIQAGSASLYVARGGNSDTFPYSTWATAASNIQDAVDAAVEGSTVFVSNATYGLAAHIHVSKGITLRGVGGAADTIIDGNDVTRCLYVDHTNAVITGFTVTNGLVGTDYGAGIWLKAGLVEQCLIMGNSGRYGSGVHLLYAGTLRHCTISGNSGPSYGGGVNSLGQVGGTVESCVITHNSSYDGGGLNLPYGTVRNSLIAGNTGSRNGGIVCNNGTRLENCTISGNYCGSASGAYAGGLKGSAAEKLYNVVLWGNSSAGPYADYYLDAGADVRHSILQPAYAGGVNCKAEDPAFVNAAAENYRLTSVSPCIGAGTNLDWMTASLTNDLDGNPRISGATVDMGCYELDVEALSCELFADRTVGFFPHSVTFTSTVAGTDLAGLYYRWSFTNSAVVNDQGFGKDEVTFSYGQAGLYTVTLVVSNSAGAVATRTREDYIRVGVGTAYVARAGNRDAYPYASWATAASNMQDAVDACVDGSLVIVSNGTYSLPRQVTVSNALTIRSRQGRDSVLLDSAGLRAFYIADSGAVIDGFTITGGSAGGGTGEKEGGGAYIDGGTIQNCIVSNNVAFWGGGLFAVNNAVVSNCLVTGNSCGGYGAGIAAVNLQGPLVVDSIIAGNSGQYGGGAYMNVNGHLRNCLIADNTGGGGIVSAGGVFISAGVLENCTIANNTCSRDSRAGGLEADGSTVVYNSIVYGNTGSASTPSYSNYTGCAAVYHSCLAPAWTGTGHDNLAADPLFTNAMGTAYYLQETSPCRDAGTNRTWAGELSFDAIGNPRVSGDRLDIGAVEYQVFPRGTLILVM